MIEELETYWKRRQEHKATGAEEIDTINLVLEENTNKINEIIEYLNKNGDLE